MSEWRKKRKMRKEMKGGRKFLVNDVFKTFYLQLYGVRHLVKDHSAREKTHCCHMGYSFRLAARNILYAPSHRQDSRYHGLCYTSRGPLARIGNSSVGPP